MKSQPDGGPAMNLKLAAGRIGEAWRNYPEARAAIRDFPSGPPILVGGTHRSGTTWFAAMLAEPGLWYVHEPFNPNKGLWREAFTYARPDDERPDIDGYVRRLLAGEFRRASNNPDTDYRLMPLRLFRPPVRRVMIKDPLACLLTGYLARRFDFQVRVLFRHPAGFVSSVHRLGWPVGEFLRRFLLHSDLMKEHLEPWRDLMERHRDSDDIEAAATLHGVLNTVQWNQIQQNPTMKVERFEDLCRDPIAEFERIFGELGLPYTHATRKRHVRLCLEGSDSHSDYHPHEVCRRSVAMADSWKRQLGLNDVNQIREVWLRFRVPLYRGDTDWSVDSGRSVG